MPKVLSERVQVGVAYAVEKPRLPPPPELPPEQAAYWREIVDAFPPEKFGPDHAVVMRELVRHMARSRKVNAELDDMVGYNMKPDVKGGDKRRSIYAQLSMIARAESKIIAVLALKLRLTPDIQHLQGAADADRRKTPSGRRPWEMHTRIPEADTRTLA